MFPFKAKLATKNKTKGTNSDQYIILHHTGSGEGSVKGVLNQLTVGPVSCHFVIDTNGDAYKIGEPTDILWHAGESQWGNLWGMNNYSMGIEIIGPLADGGFTKQQKETVRKLVQHLMATFKIPNERILRHKDVAPKRKVDPYDTLWNKEYHTWEQYRNSFVPTAA